MVAQVRAGWLLAVSLAKARGVSLRGLLGYALTWGLIGFASRVSISALGLQFASPGGAPLDTVAVLLLALPAAVLARCVAIRAPELDLVRARGRRPWQLGWAAALGLVGVVSPLPVAHFLAPAVNRPAFVGAWYLTLGLCLGLAGVLPGVAAAASVCGVLAVGSTPGVIPWEVNLLYNVDLRGLSLTVGALVLVAGVLAGGGGAGRRRSRRPAGRARAR